MVNTDILTIISANIITGFSIGIGSAIANYFVQKSLIERLNKLEEKWKK
jgi:hypothetical protein